MLIARAKLIVETELQEMIELETLMTLCTPWLGHPFLFPGEHRPQDQPRVQTERSA